MCGLGEYRSPYPTFAKPFGGLGFCETFRETLVCSCGELIAELRNKNRKK